MTGPSEAGARRPAPTLGGPARRLRPWHDDDGDIRALAAAWSDPDIGRFNRVPTAGGVGAAARWIGAADHRCDAIEAVIELEGSPGGEVAASAVDRRRGTALVSWWLLPWARGRGAATWAVGTFCSWLLGPAGLERLAAIVDPDNAASLALARRCGFVHGATTDEGRFVFERRDPGRVPAEP